jgi:hypothetical protein
MLGVSVLLDEMNLSKKKLETGRTLDLLVFYIMLRFYIMCISSIKDMDELRGVSDLLTLHFVFTFR